MSQGQRFLLLDGIALEPLERWLYETHPTPEYEPLYLDTPLAGCRPVSPCLITLEAHSPIWTRFLDEGASREAGWLLTSHASREEVITHLRWLLFVQHPWQGEQVLRIASPRVMRYLLEAEPQPSRSPLLGPINALWLPSVEDQVVRWHRVTREQVELAEPQGRFALTERHCDSLSRIAWHRFRGELAAHLSSYFATGPLMHQAGSADEAAAVVIESTAELGFTGRRAHFYLANILGAHGLDALDETVLPDLAILLTQANAQPAMERLKSAATLAQTLSNKKEIA
nr:DUF4123 domain-containing protein [uncultured Halomonas sp.]